MTASNAASRPKGRGAAPAKTVEFKGLTLKVPKEPPGDLVFSIENNEASAAVQEIFGEDQYLKIRTALKDEGLTLSQSFVALRELLSMCFDVWDMSAGE